MAELTLDKEKIAEYERDFLKAIGMKPRKGRSQEFARLLDPVTRGRVRQLAVLKATLDALEDVPIHDSNEYAKTVRLFDTLAKGLGLAKKVDEDDEEAPI